MRHTPSIFLALFSSLMFTLPAAAQYSPAAGQNAPAKSYRAKKKADGSYLRDKEGRAVFEESDEAPPQDSFGNAQGNQYDLAIDGAFEGQTVLILAEYSYALTETVAALKKKGFSSVVYRGGVPTVDKFEADLDKACQVWIISTNTAQLGDGHVSAIKRFFDAGHGVFIWGDNDPYYVDANRVAGALVPGLGMHGNLPGDRVVGVAKGDGHAGVKQGHLVTTGLSHLFEGITIASMHFDGGKAAKTDRSDWGGMGRTPQQTQIRVPQVPKGMTPIVVGSAGNLVSVAYEQDGKRLMLDGGFTRLNHKWDDAGTARFVKNAAAWLVNAERFEDKVAQK